MKSFVTLSFVFWLLFPALIAAQDEEESSFTLQPGLIATYQSLADPGASWQTIDAKPAFYIERGSPHPRLPAGEFRATWRGTIVWRESAPVSFSALVRGQVTVHVDGEIVLHGENSNGSSRISAPNAFDREPGTYSIQIDYQSPANPPAQLQIWWEGVDFSAEPLAAWHLQHAPDQLPESLLRERLVEDGRKLVGQFGCARCHTTALPAIHDPAPGPILEKLHARTSRNWLLAWLENPSALRANAHMPQLFSNDQQGLAERWAITEYLLTGNPTDAHSSQGDHRMGRRLFISLGCATCHFLPDASPADQIQLAQRQLVHLGDRWTRATLAKFLTDVHSRYPDHRMPQLPLKDVAARDIAEYLLLWSTPNADVPDEPHPPADDALNQLRERLGTESVVDCGQILLEQKGCVACHPSAAAIDHNVAIRDQHLSSGCMAQAPPPTAPRFKFDRAQRTAIGAYLKTASSERHESPFYAGQQLLKRAQCMRCHQRDIDRPPAIEQIGSTLGGAWLQRIPYQRTPRLTFAHQKYEPEHLVRAVREGVSALRDRDFTYKMPLFGEEAVELVQALAAGDGDVPSSASTEPTSDRADPTIGSLVGPELAGFQGYSCVGCHVWNGELLASPDPAAIAPDLTRTVGRIRRPWFDRMLENPLRLHPGIPMPAVFPRGRPVLLDSILDGDATRQRDALWSYFALGEDAPHPKPVPALRIEAPAADNGPRAALIPLHVNGAPIESLCLHFPSHDLIVVDLQGANIEAIYSGAVIERTVSGRIRRFQPASHDEPLRPDSEQFVAHWQRSDRHQQVIAPDRFDFLGYEFNDQHVQLHWAVHFGDTKVQATDTIDLLGRQLVWHWRISDEMRPASERNGTIYVDLPAQQAPRPVLRAPVVDAGRPPTQLERPGYRATQFKTPQSEAGEDLVMPSAIAITPRDKRVVVASMKLGELLELTDPLGDGSQSSFRDYARGLFQEAYSMTADDEGVLVLHRRNLTKIVDTDQDGTAERFQRIAALPHGIADNYDYAYGLVRDADGGFVFSYAPYASRQLPGSGGAIRFDPRTGAVEEIAYGMRNPLGWCAGPGGEIFFTDNQGEWVATNKLCHVMRGHYYGFPNTDQSSRERLPRGRTAVWVPYAWAHSINGVTYDTTHGKFGPFAGQFFMAELMFGGAIIRANVELVNGQYQGACFPFWGNGLLGPVTLAFHPDGPLFVGSITEPGWMAQPDRGGMYRIDYTGELPFEMQSIHVLPQGFRIQFTRPVDEATAKELRSYRIEHFRYEYTGAYGSPELDRSQAVIQRVDVSPDRMSVELHTAPLTTDRVYMIHADGVRSEKRESLVHPTGAYTLNELPR